MPILGRDINTNELVILTEKAARQSGLLIGSPGSGKTNLMRNLVYEYMNSPSKPALFICDPHGEWAEELISIVPPERADDVVFFSPGTQEERPQGLNILDINRENSKEVRMVVSTFVSTLRRLFPQNWGPRLDEILRRSVATVLHTPDTTLLDVYLLLASEEHRERYIEAIKDEPLLYSFWNTTFASYSRSDARTVVDSSLNKLGRWLASEVTRNTVCQPKSSWKLSELFNSGKILICDLSKGDLGEDDSSLIGTSLVNLALVAILGRKSIPAAERHEVHGFIDEFQNFAGESYPILQSECRKFFADFFVGHQYRDQLDDLNKGATMNVSNFIIFRSSGRDAMELASSFDATPPPAETQMQQVTYVPSENFEGYFEASEFGDLWEEVEKPRRAYSDVQGEMANRITNLPNWQAIVRIIGDDGRLHEHHIQTLPPQGTPNPDVAEHIRQRSLTLGTPRAEVEAYIRATIGENVDWDEAPLYD